MEQPYIPQVGDWVKLVRADGTPTTWVGLGVIQGRVESLDRDGDPVILGVPGDDEPDVGWPIGVDDTGERWVRMTPDEIALHCMRAGNG